MGYTTAIWLDGSFLGLHKCNFGSPTFDLTVPSWNADAFILDIPLPKDPNEP